MGKRYAATEDERIESDMERMTMEDRETYLRHLMAVILFLLFVAAALMIAGIGIIWKSLPGLFSESSGSRAILRFALALLMILIPLFFLFPMIVREFRIVKPKLDQCQEDLRRKKDS